MKKVKFFALALAAVTMFSCSKENNVEAPIPAGQKATLKLAVKGNGSQTKATGSTANDAVVNNLTVFAFRADGSLDVAPIYIASPAGHIVTDPVSARDSITVTTAVDSIFVVANAGPLASSPVAGVSKKADLYAAYGDLKKGSISTQTSSNLWMEGKGKVVWDAGRTTTGSVSVALSFIGAKIEFVVDLTGFTNASATKIEINDVVLLYAGGKGKFFQPAANKANQTYYFTGDNSYGLVFAPGTLNFNLLMQTVAFDGTGAMTSNNPHFYTFANNAATAPTILALRGTRADDTYYWPIHFTNSDAGCTIESGKSYTVRLKLTGSTDGNSTGGGVENPEIELISANVEVTVTPATWTVVPTIDKEFN